MATRQRPVDLGTERARLLANQLGAEIRHSRIDRGLSLEAAGKAVGLSASEVSRIERGKAPSVTLVQAARLLAVIGMELSARAFAGLQQPIRDAGQVRLLGRFHDRLHRIVRWATAVPLPGPGDQRAWDAMISVGSLWRYGVEAETGPRDSQALTRRLNLKQRDGEVDGVILLLPVSRRSRQFLEAAGETLRPNFPVSGRRALELLSAGVDPGGSAIILIEMGWSGPGHGLSGPRLTRATAYPGHG
ncbi:MAG: helix-turn-helix transcriptional regulator [Chloroflexota bacterium]